MKDCHDCKHFYEEKDTNFQDCNVHENEDYWFTEEECPSFEPRLDDEKR